MPILAAEAKGDVDFATNVVNYDNHCLLSGTSLCGLYSISFSEIIIYDNFYVYKSEEPLQVLRSLFHFIL